MYVGSTLLSFRGLSLQISFVFHRINNVTQVWKKWVSKCFFLLYYSYYSMNCVLRWNNER